MHAVRMMLDRVSTQLIRLQSKWRITPLCLSIQPAPIRQGMQPRSPAEVFSIGDAHVSQHAGLLVIAAITLLVIRSLPIADSAVRHRLVEHTSPATMTNVECLMTKE